MEDYIQRSSIDRPGFTRLTREQALEMLNITRRGIPTLAAIMNFCVYPQGYFPQLCITAIVVPGTEIGDTDQDNANGKWMMNDNTALILRTLKDADGKDETIRLGELNSARAEVEKATNEKPVTQKIFRVI